MNPATPVIIILILAMLLFKNIWRYIWINQKLISSKKKILCFTAGALSSFGYTYRKLIVKVLHILLSSKTEFILE